MSELNGGMMPGRMIGLLVAGFCVVAAPAAAQQRDSSSLAVLTALKDSAVRLAKAKEAQPALDVFLALRRHAPFAPDEARRSIRQLTLGAIPLLRAELGQLEQAAADFAAADSFDVRDFLAKDSVDRRRGGYGRRVYWTSVRAAERAVKENWAFEAGVRLLEAGDIRGVDFVLATDDITNNPWYAGRLETVLRTGAVTPAAVLAHLRVGATWVQDGALSIRSSARRGMAAWVLHRVDEVTGRRERVYLHEAVKLIQPSRPVQGLFVPLDAYPTMRLLARDLGMADGWYDVCGTEVQLLVRDGMASFSGADLGPIKAEYVHDGRTLHFPAGTPPLQGFVKLVGTPGQWQLQGKTGTYQLCFARAATTP